MNSGVMEHKRTLEIETSASDKFVGRGEVTEDKTKRHQVLICSNEVSSLDCLALLVWGVMVAGLDWTDPHGSILVVLHR